MPTLTTNPRAKFDYQILETYEAGLVLTGFEVKAAKSGRLNLKSSYITIKNNEAFLINAQLMPYQPKNTPADYDPNRTRKLLLHKKEIKKLIGKSSEKNLTLIPTKMYFNNRGFAKVEIALGKGKKMFDKRDAVKKRDIDLDIKRATRSRQKK